MDKHDACLNKALGMIENDKYRRSPEPYIFASRVLMKKHEVEADHKTSVQYLKNALKYGSKYVKYKNKTEIPENYDVFYDLDEEHLTMLGLEMAEFYFHESKVRKSTYFVRKVAKVRVDKPSIKTLEGLAYLLNRNHNQGYAMFQEGIRELQTDEQGFNETEAELLFHFLKEYKAVASAMNKTDEYHNIIDQCLEYIPSEYSEKLKYNEEEEEEALNDVSG